MARLWTCGFELQSTSAEFGVNSGVIVTGSPGISTAVHRARGAASLRINPSSATAFVEHQITTGVVMRTTHRLYLRVDSLPAAATNIYGIGAANYFPALLRLQPDGTLVLRDGFTETTLTGTSAALQLGRWYRVELDYNDVAGTLTSGVAAFKGYLDGVQFADTMCSNIGGFSRIRIGAQLAATTDLYIDDVAINDTSGSVQNGLPGAGNVVHLRPTAAGDANDWATAVGGTAGAANNWGRVAEVPPDDATSYNQTSATGTTAVDDFNVTDSGAAGIGSYDSVTLVQVGGRIASNAATAASIVYRLKGQSGGIVQESTSVTVANTSWSVHAGASPRPYRLTAYTNPQDGATWTPAALNGIQIGYRGDVSQTTVRRVSTLWALVEVVPAGSASLTVASETDAGQALTWRRARPLGSATEADTAQAAGRRKARAVQLANATETAQPLAGRKRQALGNAAESAAARTVGALRARPLPMAEETATAVPLVPVTGLGAAEETDVARSMGRAKTTTQGVAGAVEEARPLGRARARGLTVAVETTSVRPLMGGRSRALPLAEETLVVRLLGRSRAQQLPTAIEICEALAVAGGALVAVDRSVEVDTARPLPGRKRRALIAAAEVTRALIGPRVRLVQATDRAEALALVGRRQQPADRLDASTAGPALTPSTSGPVLAATTTGGG
ncbi:hypothetical protein [Streptomyces rubiginosohelvolus]|uniref:Minor tail protein n=1 Tax=Streptomyces rubiginosohelvolus TaxID=67362 RepID=A0ABQ3BN22_9ACTN|nr:hypothetical protein [Streptomyces pluricolorescens]GGZ51791.1 hypothetical protein GCM10010328_28100 [Streptomyces pluricolorescens]